MLQATCLLKMCAGIRTFTRLWHLTHLYDGRLFISIVAARHIVRNISFWASIRRSHLGVLGLLMSVSAICLLTPNSQQTRCVCRTEFLNSVTSDWSVCQIHQKLQFVMLLSSRSLSFSSRVCMFVKPQEKPTFFTQIETFSTFADVSSPQFVLSGWKHVG